MKFKLVTKCGSCAAKMPAKEAPDHESLKSADRIKSLLKAST